MTQTDTATTTSVAAVPTPETGRWWVWALRGAGTTVLVCVMILLAALAVGPRLFGGASLTVLSGSMMPTYAAGDLLVVIPQDTYRIGDAVTFQPVSGDPTLITHRIVAVSGGSAGSSYVTRGDANGSDDPPISRAQINGKVVAHVPLIGHVNLALGQHRELVIIVLGTALLAYSGYLFVARKNPS